MVIAEAVTLRFGIRMHYLHCTLWACLGANMNEHQSVFVEASSWPGQSRWLKTPNPEEIGAGKGACRHHIDSEEGKGERV